jgi:excisionase family DNA binding protein
VASPITAPLVYTVPEAAALLRLSKSKVYQLITDGRMPPRKLDGTRIVLIQADVDTDLADSYRLAAA